MMYSNDAESEISEFSFLDTTVAQVLQPRFTRSMEQFKSVPEVYVTSYGLMSKFKWHNEGLDYHTITMHYSVINTVIRT